jgi:hypothetical protein
MAVAYIVRDVQMIELNVGQAVEKGSTGDSKWP